MKKFLSSSPLSAPVNAGPKTTFSAPPPPLHVYLFLSFDRVVSSCWRICPFLLLLGQSKQNPSRPLFQEVVLLADSLLVLLPTDFFWHTLFHSILDKVTTFLLLAGFL